LIPFVSADREPNDSFDIAEELDEGSYRGYVNYGRVEDTDFYIIDVKEGEVLNLTFILVDQGYIQIYGYNTDATQDQIFFDYLDGSKKVVNLEYEQEEQDRSVYVSLQGNGEYQIEVQKTGGSLASKLPKIEPGLVGGIFFILLVLLVLTLLVIFFFRAAKASKDDIYVERDF
jgi:hypothetical protein